MKDEVSKTGLKDNIQIEIFYSNDIGVLQFIRKVERSGNK